MLKRVVSSLILLPLVLSAIWFSFPYYELLIALCVTALAWEWDNMVNNRLTPFALIVVFTSLCSMFIGQSVLFSSQAVEETVLVGQSSLLRNFIFIEIGVISLIAFAITFLAFKKKEPFPIIKGFGVIYITLFAMSACYIEDKYGAYVIFWLLMTVWVTDIGAMLVGCRLRGPKLCPSVSPLKTWSGFVGGLLFAIGFSYIVVLLFNLTTHKEILLAATVISLIAQIGDLFESKIKRIVGVKDSSNLVPGHGGVFDRLDSLMLVVIFTAIIAFSVGEVSL